MKQKPGTSKEAADRLVKGIRRKPTSPISRLSAGACWRTHLSTILDDYSRCIIAWKLCTTMKASDVTDTLELALEASA